MTENKILTAKDISVKRGITKLQNTIIGYIPIVECNQWELEQTMIEFAKYHIEAALKAAKMVYLTSKVLERNQNETKELILNAYPLDNIK